jgi:thiol-disulfide isomerase/thioredoxin
MKSILVFGAFLYFSCFLSAQVIVKGKVLGYDSLPMKRADVAVKASLEEKPMLKAAADTSGKFQITINQTGFFFLHFTGVDHSLYEIPIIADGAREVSLDVKLSLNQYVDKIEGVSIIGDFNDFDFKSAVKMTKTEDGLFVAEFPTRKIKFAYQLLGIEKNGRSVNGTLASEYEPDGGGDYRSVIFTEKGKAVVTFDPALLKRSDARPEIIFYEENSFDESIYKIYSENVERRKKFFTEYNRSGGRMPNIDWTVDVQHIEEQLSTEENPPIRKMLYTSYLTLQLFNSPAINDSIVDNAFTEIESSSLFWSYDPQLLGVVFAKDNLNYIHSVVEENPDRNVRAFALFMLLSEAHYTEKVEDAKKYYTALMKDYGDTQIAKSAKVMNPVSPISKGNPVPDFKIESLDNPDVRYSKNKMLGKIYLIDFWATWCMPCIQEMGTLHNAYSLYKDKGFEILSISFDRKPEDIGVFRKGVYKMPWLHSFAEKGFQDPIAEQFEVYGIPKPILVDSSGGIIAVGNELRGENLLAVLKSVFDEEEKTEEE